MIDPNRRPSCPGRSFGFGAILRRAFLYGVAAVGVSSIAWAVEDASLTAVEYESLGMPAADRTWGATEYEAAASALGKLAASNPERLPRRGSSKSGAVFERIVAQSNLTAIATASLPLETRVNMAASLMKGQAPILGTYLGVAEKMTGAEVTDLMGFQLRTAVAVTLLVQEMVMEMSLFDPARDARIDDYERMTAGLAKILAGVLQALMERGDCQVSDRLRLASTVAELWPVFLEVLPKGARKELPAALRRMIQGEPEKELEPVLSRLLAKSEVPFLRPPSSP